jgi:hypothetical protein
MAVPSLIKFNPASAAVCLFRTELSLRRGTSLPFRLDLSIITRLALCAATIHAASVWPAFAGQQKELSCSKHTPRRQNITKARQNPIGRLPNSTARMTIRRVKSTLRKLSCIPRPHASIPRRRIQKVRNKRSRNVHQEAGLRAGFLMEPAFRCFGERS